MDPSSVTQLLYKQLTFRSEREKVLATNIANIDTPNYKTKDLKFKDAMDKASQDPVLTLKVTNKAHFQIANHTRRQPNLTTYEVKGLPEQNDGNNVNLDMQMSQQAQNSVMFSAIQNSIKKDISWFKSIIDASAKN